MKSPMQERVLPCFSWARDYPALKNFTVITTCEFPLRRHGGLDVVRDGLLDMIGPAAGFTPFSKTINLVCSLKLKPDLDEDQYEYPCVLLE